MGEGEHFEWGIEVDQVLCVLEGDGLVVEGGEEAGKLMNGMNKDGEGQRKVGEVQHNTTQ